jgi:hypothetical protein
MSTLSIRSRNTKSAAPKKGSGQSKTASRRKVPSTAANAKKPTRSVESKAERARFHIQLLATTLSNAPRLKNRLDFCRKGRIAMGAGRWTWPPGETLRARLAMCGALGRASVNSDAVNQRSLTPCRPFP